MAESGKRTLLKISGEALAGENRYGVDATTLRKVAAEIKAAHQVTSQIGIVIGAGNIIRGSDIARGDEADRTTADYAGMVATIINSLALQSALEGAGMRACVQSAIPVQEIAEPFSRRHAVEHLESGRIVVFAGGTGNPFFTTDTAAALRAVEIGATVLLMAKNRVDGVYDGNPRTTSDVRRFATLNYGDVIERRLGVMDNTAVGLCMEHNLPIIVFDASAPDAILRAVRGEKIGTLVADVETTYAT